jgi:hypothetical protein
LTSAILIVLLDERFIYEERYNPYAKAAAGYVWLASQWNVEHSHLPWWDPFLAEDFVWLSDTWILRGWALLQLQRREAALTCFVTAVRRGPPIYLAGLKLLLRGLIALEGEEDLRESVRDHLPVVRRYAAAVDPTNPFCTFYGASPDSPEPPFMLE